MSVTSQKMAQSVTLERAPWLKVETSSASLYVRTIETEISDSRRLSDDSIILHVIICANIFFDTLFNFYVIDRCSGSFH